MAAVAGESCNVPVPIIGFWAFRRVTIRAGDGRVTQENETLRESAARFGRVGVRILELVIR
jgi:hypothetical protein